MCGHGRHHTRRQIGCTAASLQQDPSEERRNQERRDQDPDSGAKRQAPAQRVDQQAQIARVPDDTINAAGNQPVPRLNRHEAAESLSEYENRPKPQRSTGDEKTHPDPANRISIDRPELRAVRVGWQIGVQQPNYREHCNDPAVRTILPHASNLGSRQRIALRPTSRTVQLRA
jgi:hypothetical protein